jgi:hypothetical protein
LPQVAIGQSAAPEFQRIAVDHVGHGGRQIAAAEPQCLGAGPDQHPVGTLFAYRALKRGAQIGLVEAPGIGDAAPAQRHRNVARDR